MTIFFDDLVGPSPRLHGSEECSWKRMMDSLDLTDHYLIVASKKGSIFTRHTTYGLFLDQSCLDRVYYNNQGS